MLEYICVCVSYPFYSLVSATNITPTSASWTCFWRCFSSSDVFQDLRMSQVKKQQWFRVVFTIRIYQGKGLVGGHFSVLMDCDHNYFLIEVG